METRVSSVHDGNRKEDLSLMDEIRRLKKQKNAVLLAHYYQIPEIQDIADFVGDSLALAQQAKDTTADIILFAGVHFMAETAKILNPDKKVLIPDPTAGCSLADACKADDLKAMKAEYPDHMVLSYVNCSAEVKCLSDLICTSGNALKLVNALPVDQKILFVPDRNLGGYINRMTGRNMRLWPGCCEVHDMLEAEKVLKLKQAHPEARLIAHPECNPAVLEVADFVGSTAAMLKFIKEDVSNAYVVATETGILHAMHKICPEKTFYIAGTDGTCGCNDCPHMKKNTLEKIHRCLVDESPEIILSDEVIEMASKPIEAMLRMS
ncbi:MAG: quinolinate synthase NadA [Bacteroidales bacterium]|nr:quinolinate synthase NadA [Bacteroidales bacterium]